MVREIGHDAKLDAALKYNQRVWTIFQAELEKPENPLPNALKADLLRLSAFIDKRTLETIAYPSPEKLTILININHNIARRASHATGSAGNGGVCFVIMLFSLKNERQIPGNETLYRG